MLFFCLVCILADFTFEALGYKRAHPPAADVDAVPEGPSKKRKVEETSKPKTSPKGKHPKDDAEEPFDGGDMFKTYNLKELGIPLEARPVCGKIYKVQHGFTLQAKNKAVHWFA